MDDTGALVRLAFAAFLTLLIATPALAGGSSAITVGLVVTGNLASPLAGNWVSSSAARGGIYHFAVGDGTGTFHQLVSIPLRDASAGSCDLRISGVIYSLEPAAGRAASYDMRYAIQSADIVTASSDADACEDIAASYLSDAPATDSLILSRTNDRRLVDSVTGVEYTRTR
jgi:hypothetical protein